MLSSSPPTLADLKKRGFTRSASLYKQQETYKLEGELPKAPGLYLFVIDSIIKYVGIADSSLWTRVRRYRESIDRIKNRPDPEYTPRKVYTELLRFLNLGKKVNIYTLQIRGKTRIGTWKGLPIDRLHGLEAGLIETIDPPWNPRNKKGRVRRAEEVTSRN